MSRKTRSSYLYLRDRQRNIANPLQQQLRARRFMTDRLEGSQRDGYLYCANLAGHFGCVNAIEFSNNGGQYLISGGDDRRVLFWNLEKEVSNSRSRSKKIRSYFSMKGEHNSNIFCLAFDANNDKVLSGGNDDQVIVHDTITQETLDVFSHEDAVYGISSSPSDPSSFVSAGADGRVLVWDLRESTKDPFVLSNYTSAFHGVAYHPMEPRFLATANAKEGVALWDIRKPRTCLLRYSSAYTQLNAMSVRFDMFGNRILALRRRLPPVIYNIDSNTPLFEFDHAGYYNSCTMKSSCFAGDRDQYILSGSDDFNVFMWKVPDVPDEKHNGFVGEASLVLTGHRQIVNQVRYNYNRSIIASSGVEKVIKLWCPIQMPGMFGRMDNNRKMYTHQQYFELMINSNSTLSHDYSEKSTEEDPQMFAFFDSLIQREVDRSFSSDSEDSEMSLASLHFHYAPDSDSNSSQSESNNRSVQLPALTDTDEDDEPTYTNLSVRKKASESENSKLNLESLSGVRESTEFSEALDTAKDAGPSHDTSRKEKKSSSSSESTESDESEDFYIMQFKNRFFRRISAQRKKKNKFGLNAKKIGFKVSKTQEEKDRLANLKQRAAFCQVLKERIPKTSSDDSDSEPATPQINDEEFRSLSDMLNQRTEGARQRGAALRVKKLQIASDTIEASESFKIRGHESAKGGSINTGLSVNGHSCDKKEVVPLEQQSNPSCKPDSNISHTSGSFERTTKKSGENSACPSTNVNHMRNDLEANGVCADTRNDLCSGFKKVKKGTKRKYRSHIETQTRDSESDS